MLDCRAKGPIAPGLETLFLTIARSVFASPCLRRAFAIRAVFLAAGGGISATAKALGVGNGLVAKVGTEIRARV
jgi:hypothetical protein